MHTVIRQYTGNSLREIIKREESSLRQTMTGVPGFRGYYMVETKDGLATITVCDDIKGTQESTRRAAEWVKDHVPASANLSKPVIIEGETIRGAPGSRGRYTGVARIIPSVADSARLGHGEVLVAPTTSPPWTPFFAIAGAIVTETGGPLSHCAIVAREYGIPAVVGAGLATQRIRDGQFIEVDGDAGLVRLLEP